MRIQLQTLYFTILLIAHHSEEVVHVDINPANVLLSRDRTAVKLCDFQSSHDINEEDRAKFAIQFSGLDAINRIFYYIITHSWHVKT